MGLAPSIRIAPLSCATDRSLDGSATSSSCRAWRRRRPAAWRARRHLLVGALRQRLRRVRSLLRL
eukprot:4461659-Prymnesium_polylepis.1